MRMVGICAMVTAMLSMAACGGSPDATDAAGAVVVGGGTGQAMGMPANPDNPLAVVAPPAAVGMAAPIAGGAVGGGTGKAMGTPANPVNPLAPQDRGPPSP